MKKNESNHLDSKTVLNASTHFGMTVLRLVFLLMMCFVVLYPILYMFSVSVREAKDLYDPTVIWIPRNFTMENYKYIWELIDYPGCWAKLHRSPSFPRSSMCSSAR